MADKCGKVYDDPARAIQRLFSKLDEEDMDTLNYLLKLAKEVGCMAAEPPERAGREHG